MKRGSREMGLHKKVRGEGRRGVINIGRERSGGRKFSPLLTIFPFPSLPPPDRSE